MVNIANSLGVGSGIDTVALVDALVAAERAPRDKSIKARGDLVTARITGLGQVRSGLDTLITALGNRTRAGGLGPLPGSSDTSILTASATAGATRTLQPTSIEVRALASGQSLVSAALATTAATVGQGTLTLTLGTATPDEAGGFSFAGGGAGVDIVIGPDDDSLGGLAAAINKAQASVHATVIDDGRGARLVLKGAAGANSAFILTTSGDAGLDRFVHRPGSSAMSVAASARDADLLVDGVAVTRPSNSFDDLIDKVHITLTKAAVGTVVTVAASRDAPGLRTAVGDLVDALNALQSLAKTLSQGGTTDAAAGALAGDATIRTVQRQLSSLTTGSGAGLVKLGLTTARDGSLSVDTVKLDAALAADPDAVEAVLVALTAAGGPLAAARDGLTGAATTGSTGRLVREQKALTAQAATLDERMTALRTQLTKQYSAMEVAVASFKATQSFLDQQIKAWNRSD